MWIKGSKVNGHIDPLWSVAVELWPLLTKIRTSKVYETIHFLKLHDNLINLSPVSLKWTNLKNWPCTIELTFWSMTFCCFGLYLKNETSYGFHVIYFFAPYDPRKNLICITTKSNHFHYSTNLDGWTLTLCNAPCAADFEWCPP